MKKTNETALVKQCLEYLHLNGIFAWRQNTTGIRRTTSTGRQFWQPSEAKGVSDILGVLSPSGRLLAVECKVRPNTPTEDQLAFLAAVQERGGMVVVCYEVEQLIAAIGKEVEP